MAVEKRDLSSPCRFLQVAETYDKAGKADLSLEWAEKGVAAFPDRPDSRLAEFLAAKYHELGRHDEAMDLVWAEFVRAPYRREYEGLRPGMVAMSQTFGDQLNPHPHVHALVTRGGWTASGEWVSVPYVDPSAAEELFRHKVIGLLQRADLLDEDRTRLLLSWHHSGFRYAQ